MTQKEYWKFYTEITAGTLDKDNLGEIMEGIPVQPIKIQQAQEAPGQRLKLDPKALENTYKKYFKAGEDQATLDIPKARVVETKDKFIVEQPGRWCSLSYKYIEFWVPGTYKKAEVYKELRGDIAPSTGLVEAYSFLPEDVYKKVNRRITNYHPVTLKDPENIPPWRVDFYKKVLNKEVDKIPPINLDQHIILEDRYIVYLYDIDEGYKTPLVINDRLILEEGAIVAGWPISTSFYSLLKNWYLIRNQGSLKVCLVDLFTWKSVVNEVKANTAADLILNKYKDQILADDKLSTLVISLKLANALPEKEFIVALNKHFIEGGWPDLTCSKAKLTVTEKNKSAWDFHRKNWVKENKKCIAYNCTIKYKNNILIGPDLGYGYVYVGEDFSMVVSAWCQRTSRWSKETANIVDQINIWDITDWLTGPIFEKAILEGWKIAPIIKENGKFFFMGRDNDKANKKQSAIEALKKAARLAK